MRDELMMRISSRFPMPVVFIAFVFSFTLAVFIWLRSTGGDAVYKIGQFGRVETSLDFEYKDIDEVRVIKPLLLMCSVQGRRRIVNGGVGESHIHIFLFISDRQNN